MALWTTDELVTRVKRKAQWPDSGKLSDTEILAVADEELQSYVAPLVRRSAQAFWVKQDNRTTTAGTSEFRLSSLVTSGTLYDVSYIGQDGIPILLPVLTPNDVYRRRLNPALTGTPRVCTVEGDILRVYPIPASTGDTIRIRYERRPSKLIATTSCAAVTVVGSSTLTAATSLGNGTYDVVQANPNFDTLVVAQTTTVSGGGPYIYTMTGATLTSVAVGDYICPTGQTCIVTVPDVLQWVMVDKVAAECLLEAGDGQSADRITAALAAKLEQVLSSLEPRVRTDAPVIFNRYSPLRCGR